MDRSEQIDALAVALVKAQAGIKGAVKDSLNPHFRSKYADLESVMDACKGPLNENGISVLQIPEPVESGVGIRTVLLHESGQYISGVMVLPMVKQDPQGAGSAITYARRYGLMAMVGVCPEDDDGEGAMQREQPQQRPAPVTQNNDSASEAQLKAIHAMLTRMGVKDREQGLSIISAAAKRPVGTSKELTRAEASMVIEALKEEEAA